MNDRPYTQRDMLVFFFGVVGVVAVFFVALALIVTTTCEAPQSPRQAPITLPEVPNHAPH